jgi:hypothetical protein
MVAFNEHVLKPHAIPFSLDSQTELCVSVPYLCVENFAPVPRTPLFVSFSEIVVEQMPRGLLLPAKRGEGRDEGLVTLAPFVFSSPVESASS